MPPSAGRVLAWQYGLADPEPSVDPVQVDEDLIGSTLLPSDGNP